MQTAIHGAPHSPNAVPPASGSSRTGWRAGLTFVAPATHIPGATDSNPQGAGRSPARCAYRSETAPALCAPPGSPARENSTKNRTGPSGSIRCRTSGTTIALDAEPIRNDPWMG